MSWFKAGSTMTISDRMVTKTQSGYATAYGAEEVSEGQHEWKIKAHSTEWLVLGISSNTNYCEGYFWSKDDTDCYGLFSHRGTLYSKKGSDVKYANGAAIFGKDDIITIHLNFDKQEMSFSKNSSNIGIAFNNIVKGQKYRLSVNCRDANKFELISNVSVSSEEKKEEPNYIKQC
eukprot:349006_1